MKEVSELQKEIILLKRENEILIRLLPLSLKSNDSVMIDFIKELGNEYSVKTICGVLDIPRSTYYQKIS